jgi:pilus assembly protein CpaB
MVTLIVTPQDSITMSYLIYSGAKITMTLRKATDESRVATEAATLQFLLSQYNIPVPAKLPYAMQPRIDELISPFLPGDVVTVAPEQ